MTFYVNKNYFQPNQESSSDPIPYLFLCLKCKNIGTMKLGLAFKTSESNALNIVNGGEAA